MKRSAFAALLAASVSGCLSPGHPDIGLSPVFYPKASIVRGGSASQDARLYPEDIPDVLKVGDTAVVTTTWGKVHTFKVYRVTASEFAGRDPAERKYRIRHLSVRKLVVERGTGADREVREYSIAG